MKIIGHCDISSMTNINESLQTRDNISLHGILYVSGESNFYNDIHFNEDGHISGVIIIYNDITCNNLIVNENVIVTTDISSINYTGINVITTNYQQITLSLKMI